MLELTINLPKNLNGEINFFNVYNIYLHIILGRHCLSFAYSSTEIKPVSPFLSQYREYKDSESGLSHQYFKIIKSLALKIFTVEVRLRYWHPLEYVYI